MLNNTTLMPDYNITLHAKWNKVKEELKYKVTVTFSKTNVTKADIEKEVINIVGEDKYFEVKEENGEIVVIISYNTTEEANNFVKDVKGNSILRENVLDAEIGDPGAASILQINIALYILFFINQFIL